MKRVIAVILFGLAASPALATAQMVGHPPSSSPFHDLPYKQELTISGGQFNGSTGDAGVGPGSGGVVGVRYGLRLGGPVQFMAHLARTFSDRTVLNPADTGAARTVGTTSAPVYLADVGLSFNLTGQKSYHRLVPVIGVGLGVASDGGKEQDAGGFALGTPFAFNFGGGIRWTPAGHYQLRAEFTDYLYKLSYPPSYFQAQTTGSAPILPPNASSKQWTHNPVLTLGISYVY